MLAPHRSAVWPNGLPSAWLQGSEMMKRASLLILTIVSSFAAVASIMALPHPDHVVIVIMENHSFGQIIGNSAAPNINALAAEGANIVNAPADSGAITSGSHASRHPSQPTYLELFSGNHHG